MNPSCKAIRQEFFGKEIGLMGLVKKSSLFMERKKKSRLAKIRYLENFSQHVYGKTISSLISRLYENVEVVMLLKRSLESILGFRHAWTR